MRLIFNNLPVYLLREDILLAMSQIYSLLAVTLLWTAWCFLHSFLISSGFTARMKKNLGSRFGYYRLAYSIFSLVSLAPVIYFHFSLEERLIFTWPWPWAVLKFSMYLAAFLLFYGGLAVYDVQYMLGIRQIREMRAGIKPAAAEFTTKGILGYVRHPWYSGAILLVWAFGDITDISLVSKTVLTAYLIIGTILEEKKLVKELGQPYLDYRRKVPMLIPGKKSKM